MRKGYADSVTHSGSGSLLVKSQLTPRVYHAQEQVAIRFTRAREIRHDGCRGYADCQPLDVPPPGALCSAKRIIPC